VTDPEFSEALVHILDSLVTPHHDKQQASAIVDLALAFAERNECWTTYFRATRLFDRLCEFFPLKSATTRTRLLKLLYQAFKQCCGPDVFDISIVIASMVHSMESIQSAAVECIIKYIEVYPTRIPQLVGMKLCDSLLAVLEGGSFTTRCLSIDLIEALTSRDDDMIGEFLDRNVMAAILPLLRDSMDERRVNTMLRVLRRMRSFCVARGLGKLFVEKFEESEGFDAIEGLAGSVTNGILKDEARIFILEMNFLEALADGG
jgi:hypothetical protein